MVLGGTTPAVQAFHVGRPLTSVGAAPGVLEVSAPLRQQLDAAVADGRAVAKGWATAHPAGQPAEFDAVERGWLVAPPAPGTPAGVAELDVVRAAAQTRTPAGNDVAKYHASYGGWQVWARYVEELRTGAGPAQAAEAERLIRQSLQRTHDVVDAGKQHFARKRPYDVDRSIGAVVPLPIGNPGYPSGHAAAAYAAATTLAGLLPQREGEFMDLAAQVAYSRVYGGVHFPGDVVAAAHHGAAIASDVLRRATAPAAGATAPAAA